MRQPIGDAATLPQPRGSGLAPDRWQLAVTYALNLREAGEPALVSEQQGELLLEWEVSGDAAALWRVVLLDPAARTLPADVEATLKELQEPRDRRLGGPAWMTFVLLLGVIGLAAVAAAFDNGFPPATVLAAVVSLAGALLLVWLGTRRPRVWRERRLLIDGDIANARHAQELVVAYVQARERGDADAAAGAQRQLWERADPLPDEG